MAGIFSSCRTIRTCCCLSPSDLRSGSDGSRSRAMASAWSPRRIVVGCGLSVWGSVYGAKLELNNFAKSLFYYLFMYGVGLRVGPSFINAWTAMD